jgi:glycosyltransferase involved in cell wall biosynthesis
MTKFSVIIPTIWKGDYLNELLDSLYKSDYVDEVILINNDKLNTYPNLEKNEKLTYVEPGKNIFVNPAWNMGVKISRNNKIIIAQDDLLFDVDVLGKLVDLIENSNNKLNQYGILGMSYGNYFLDNNMDYVSVEHFQHAPAWACILLFDKSVWKEIPDQLKIWYGDDFIKYTSKPLLQIRGLKIVSKISTSVNSSADWISAVLENDRIEWNKLLNR